MKAVVFRGIGDVRLEDVAEPRIEQPTDAIVRLTASAICGTDLHMVRGTMPGMKAGTILGYEGVGVVEELGKGVRNLAIGDRVVIPSTIACGSASIAGPDTSRNATTPTRTGGDLARPRARQGLQRRGVDAAILHTEQDKANEPDGAQVRRAVQHRSKRNPRGARHRKSEDAGRDCREGDRGEAVFIRQSERLAIARCEQRVGRLVAAPDRAEAMDDEAVWQGVPAGDDGLSRADRRQLPTLLVETRPGGAMDGAGDAAAARKLGIGGVDDAGEIALPRDVAPHALDRNAVRGYAVCRLGHQLSSAGPAARLAVNRAAPDPIRAQTPAPESGPTPGRRRPGLNQPRGCRFAG